MDDDDVDEITFTNSNHHNYRISNTGTSITSISDDRRSVSTLNQQCFDEILLEEDNDEMNLEDFCE